MRLCQCVQFQAAKRAPAASEKTDNHRTPTKGFGEGDEIASVAPEPEQRRLFTAFTACRTKPICTSSATEPCTAATIPGAVLASKARRHASSCAFKDMWLPVELIRRTDKHR